MAVGLPITAAGALVIYATALAASLLTIIPGGIGTVEASTTALLIGAGATRGSGGAGGSLVPAVRPRRRCLRALRSHAAMPSRAALTRGARSPCPTQSISPASSTGPRRRHTSEPPRGRVVPSTSVRRRGSRGQRRTTVATAGRAGRRAVARDRPRLRAADGARAAAVPHRPAAGRAARARRRRARASSTTPRCSSTSAATPTPTSRPSGSATTSRSRRPSTTTSS